MLSEKKRRAKAAFNLARLGLGAGILAIAAASAFMNISGWIAIAETTSQMFANAGLSSGLELTALFALPYAGRVMGRGTYVKALIALAIGGAAMGVNIFATYNFLDVQTDFVVNNIETASADVGLIDSQIADRQQEMNSIIDRNDGVPRDVETLEESGKHFPDEDNPINARERDNEIGDRRSYERLQGEVDALREQRAGSSVLANDTVNSVIPDEHLKTFVTVLELMKATGLYVLGNSRLFYGRNYNDNRKWAAIRARQRAKRTSTHVSSEHTPFAPKFG
jgi:hypothetical protein